MAANLIIQDSGGAAEVTAASFTDAAPGDPTAAQQFRVYNDPSGGPVDTALGVALLVYQINDEGDPVRGGLTAVDEKYVEVRALDTGTSDQQETAWTPIGRWRVLTLADIASGEYTVIEVRYHPPGSAATAEVQLLLDVEDSYIRDPLGAGHTESHRDGILTGLGDGTFSEIQRGGTVSESGSPDANVNLEDTVYVHLGKRYAVSGATALDGNDASAAALSSGEHYWATLSLGASGVTVTKSDKAADPADEGDAPSVPSGEIPLARVLREFDGIINDADITMLSDCGAFEWSVSGITATVGPGWALIDNAIIRRTAQTVGLSLTDDDENYVWLEPDGSISVSQTASEPAPRSLLLYHATAASGAVTQLRDRRGWIGGETVHAHFDFATAADAQTAYWKNPHQRAVWLRVDRSALVEAFGAPSGNATGELRLVPEYREPGGSWTALFPTGEEPGITVNEDTDDDAFPEVMLIPAEASIRVTTDLATGYDSTAPTDIYLTLTMEAA